MTTKGASRQIERHCLVCGEATKMTHMGVDTCRACAVFYRRYKSRSELVCRATTGQCPPGKGLNCRRCRFEHMKKLLNQHKNSPKMNDSSSCEPNSESTESTMERLSAPTTFSKPFGGSILECLKIHYRTMCLVRLHSELSARSDPPHPLEISLETGPFYPATFGSMSVANRIFMCALLEFANSVFPEFSQLPKEEKWIIIANNFYQFRHFEGCYRSEKLFPGNMDRTFGGFTVWMSVNDNEFFYSDAQGIKREQMLQCAKHNKGLKQIRATRELITRSNLCNEEFLVILVLMFWCLGDAPVREETAQIGERYREAILKELHAFYRDSLKLDDYTSRLGELMLLLPAFDRSIEMKEYFEVLRLIGVLPEDNFTYQLQKSV